MVTIAVGSALLGTSIAINTHSQTPPQTRSTAAAPHAPTQLVIEPAPQLVRTEPGLPSNSSPLQVNPQAISTDELDIVREQLRRAIHDRNPVLLRSLMQASSLRQVLTTLAVPEQVNLDNLYASTWAVLEKAIAYRCRHLRGQTLAENMGSCLESPQKRLQ